MRAKSCRSARPKSCSNEPAHTFVGYFIGSPGMNVIPCEISGKRARVGVQIGALGRLRRHRGKDRARHSPGIRSLSSDRSGHPVQIEAVENIGRFKIVRANLQGHAINALLKENEEVPADPTLSFEAGRINVYENSHLVRPGA
jgi:glycerol transport system ATP-binding protein